MSLEEFDATTEGDEPSAIEGTIFFIHGNRVSGHKARTNGLAAYRQWKRRANLSQRFRFVIWSWPAEALRGPLRDVRIKAARSVPASYQLAWFLDRMPPESPIGLAGFSLGARVITGALHLLGNGQLGPYELAEREHSEREPLRVVLMAAATHSYWLEPDQAHGQALSQTDRMLLLNNSCDKVLKLYRFIDRCSRPKAMGYAGIASRRRLGPDSDKVEQFDACWFLGRHHSLLSYLGSESLMDRSWEVLAPSANDQ